MGLGLGRLKAYFYRRRYIAKMLVRMIPHSEWCRRDPHLVYSKLKYIEVMGCRSCRRLWFPLSRFCRHSWHYTGDLYLRQKSVVAHGRICEGNDECVS